MTVWLSRDVLDLQMLYLVLALMWLGSVTMGSLPMRLECTYDGHSRGMVEFMLQDLLSARLRFLH